jgi:hypothetical protein
VGGVLAQVAPDLTSLQRSQPFLDIARRKMEAAERDLDRSRPLHRRRREQLRADIELHRRALEVADERLAGAVASLEDARLQLRTVDRATSVPPVRLGDEVSRGSRTGEPRVLHLQR